MPLLDLPEALRRRIWEAVLVHGQDTIPLLQTCRQILVEAQPLVFNSPAVFNSQYDMVEWVGRVGSKYARGTRILHLTLQDLEVLPQNTNSGHLSWPSLSLLELYQSETEKIIELLARCPNITELALLKPTTVRSYLYNDFYFSVLRRATHELPNLKGVAFYSDEHSLHFAKALPVLRRLSFTGFSRNSPMETSSILSRLRHLDELEIILPNTPVVFGGLDLETTLPKTQSLTREVIRDLRGLRSFTLRERKDQYKPSPTFCTPRFIQALESGHRASLQKLKIDLDFAPDITCQRAIRSFCQASTLKHVDIVWPGMRGDLLHSLPKSVVSLRTSPSFGRPPYWVLLVIQWKKAEFPNLRDVYLVGDSRSSTLSAGATSTQAFRSARAALAAINITTHIEPLSVTQIGRIRAQSAITPQIQARGHLRAQSAFT